MKCQNHWKISIGWMWLRLRREEPSSSLLPHVPSSKYTLYKQPDLYFRFVKLHKTSDCPAGYWAVVSSNMSKQIFKDLSREKNKISTINNFNYLNEENILLDSLPKFCLKCERNYVCRVTWVCSANRAVECGDCRDCGLLFVWRRYSTTFHST